MKLHFARLAAILLAGCLSAALAACGSTDGETLTASVTFVEASALEGHESDVLADFPLGSARIALPLSGMPETDTDEQRFFLFWSDETLCLSASAAPFPAQLSLFDMEGETLTAYAAELAEENGAAARAGYTDVLILGQLPFIRLCYRDEDTQTVFVAYHTLIEGTSYTLVGWPPDGGDFTEAQDGCLRGIAASLHFDGEVSE